MMCMSDRVANVVGWRRGRDLNPGHGLSIGPLLEGALDRPAY